MITKSELAKFIDHTLLKPDSTEDDIIRICEEAQEFRFWGVCVAPSWVRLAKKLLRVTNVRVATVVGFPHGNTLPTVKAYEAERSVDEGAQELDMVLNIGLLKSRHFESVQRDIESVTAIAQKHPGSLVKVIIETALLTTDEKVAACEIAIRAGADYVKTSTGFAVSRVKDAPTGATVDDIRIIRRTVGAHIGIKAAGGIRNLRTALSMIEAGATRIGSSSSVAILAEFCGQEAADE